MTNWQKQFSEKIESVRTATRDVFERKAQEALDPTFKDFAEFTTRLHVRATSPLHKPGIRSYKFTMAENTYVLMTFRLVGLQCEAQSEYFIPGHAKLAPSAEFTELNEFNRDWCRKIFEQTLDCFLDTYTQTIGDLKPQLVGAGSH